jgi:hypothetical protein
MTSTTFRFGGGPYELVIFDLRAPGARRRQRSECTAWGEDAAVELLDSDHTVLIVFAGSAARMEGRGAA